MAQVKYAVLKNRHQLNEDSFLLDLELEADEIKRARGGQYLIINTGLELAPGKALKRAYSLFSCHETEQTVQIAIKALPGGPASQHLSQLPLGRQLAFSGPWGKLSLEASEQQRVHVFASYTGITAALGLIIDRRYRRQELEIHLHWLRPSQEYFLSDSMVQEILHFDSDHTLRIYDAPQADDPMRLAFANQLFRQCSINENDLCVATGDGLLNLEFQRYLQSKWPGKSCQVENFFHKPQT